ncbi:MAG: threonylcarbamoyl-AMP synthase [Proteobacteria bacterium]|nr:threonylcarbamoyl-AMP synthase [Pseudomonadota bacterium]
MITKNLNDAVTQLKQGQLVAVPTETVYGLAANALDAKAVAKIFALKERPVDHPLIVHVSTMEQAKSLVTSFPEKAEKLAKAFWPGPLTLVLSKNDRVPELTTGGMQSVAIRVPNHPAPLAIIEQCGFPLAAPSANPFGRISPTTALHVEQSFGAEAPLVFDGGPCQVGVESTIVSFLNEDPCVLRLGGLAVEEIEKVIGPVAQVGKSAKSIAPGMLPQHYAPRTPLVILEEKDSLPSGRLGLLSLHQPANKDAFEAYEILSPEGSLEQAASGFYSALRRLDEASLDAIVAYRFPDKGLGKALNDRLERASHLN